MDSPNLIYFNVFIEKYTKVNMRFLFKITQICGPTIHKYQRVFLNSGRLTKRYIFKLRPFIWELKHLSLIPRLVVAAFKNNLVCQIRTSSGPWLDLMSLTGTQIIFSKIQGCILTQNRKRDRHSKPPSRAQNDIRAWYSIL